MNDRRFLVPFINLGHLLDHLVMLVFPTVVIALAREWGRPYSEMLPLALGGFIAFGAFAIPAGWLADHWSRYRMMAVFFFGIGLSLSLTGFARTPSRSVRMSRTSITVGSNSNVMILQKKKLLMSRNQMEQLLKFCLTLCYCSKQCLQEWILQVQ